MATEVLELQVRATGVSQSSNQFDQLTRSVSGVRSALGFLRNALVVFSAIRAFSGVVGLIDAFTEMTTKLKLVTNNTEELTAVTQALFNVSQETRTSFESNVTLFNRVARATTFLHLTYSQLIDTTRTVAQLIQLSGATTAEATGSLIQFSQALAANNLSGDELRSTLENFPKLADVIGKEFGIAGAALRGFVNAHPGAITTEKIIDAIRKATSTTNEEFKKTLPTISQGFILVANSITLFIGRLNQVSGVGGIIFEALKKVAENIDLVITALLALGALAIFNVLANQVLFFATSVGQAGSIILGVFNFILGSVGTLTRAIFVLGVGLTNIFAGNAVAGASTLVTSLTAIGSAAKVGAVAIAQFAIAFVGFVAQSAAAAISLARFIALSIALGSIGAAARIAAFSTELATGAAIVARFAGTLPALVSGFSGLGSALLAAAAAMGRLALATLANPLFLGAAIVIAVIIGLFFLLRDSVGKLIDSFGGLRGIVNSTFALIETSISLLFNHFDLLWKAIAEQAFNAFESIKGVILGALDTVSVAIKTVSLGQLDLGTFDFKAAQSQFAGAGQELSDTFKKNFTENLAADPLKQTEDGVASGLKFIKGLLNPADINNSVLGNKPPGQDTPKPDSTNKSKLQSLQQQVESFIGRVDPFFEINSKIDKMKTLFEKARDAGVDIPAILARAGIASKQVVFDRIEREELGVGNATAYYESTVKLLDSALKRVNLTQNEYTEAIIKNRIVFLEAQRDVASGIELAKKQIDLENANQTKIAADTIRNALAESQATEQLGTKIAALAIAKKDGTLSAEQHTLALRRETDAVLEQQRDFGSGIQLAKDAITDQLTNGKEIAKQVVTDALSQKTALQLLAEQTKALTAAKNDGTLSEEQFARALRDTQIAALDTQTDTASGFARGMLKVQKDLSDTAKLSEQVVTDAFGGMTDALVTFAQTGKLSLSDLFNTIEKDLLKLAISESITKPLAGLLGVGGGQSAGGGGLLGGLFNTVAGSAGTTPSTGGLFGSLFSGGTGGGLFSGLFGAATGGSFLVGGQGGTDSQLVAFRATPNERVSIDRPGQDNRAPGTSPAVVQATVAIHVHGVTDADSFSRSADQVAARAGQAVNRALARNG